MKKLLCMMLTAGALAGCIPTPRPNAPTGAADAAKKDAEEKKGAEEKKLPALPPVTKETFNEYNYDKKGVQALAEELERDEKKPVKVLVEARK